MERIQSLLSRGSVRHLSLEDSVYVEPPNTAPNPLCNPNNEGAPAPPSDGGVMHPRSVKDDRNKEDVGCIEGFIEVVPDWTESGGHQDSEWNEGLKRNQLRFPV